MDVRMTIMAALECQSHILHNLGTPWLRFVAFLARHADVFAPQRIAGLRVIELAGWFPIIESMTARAVLTELPLVTVGVAREAIAGEPQKRPVEILEFNGGALGRSDVA